MSDRSEVFEDTFNLLCGNKIGEGAHRMVYECRLRPELVVKVEREEVWRNNMNIFEMKFWDDASDAVRLWLAPCHFLSPDGHILLQSKCEPVHTSELPDTVPGFINDIKAANMGIFDGRVVFVDYAITNQTASMRLKKANWN